MLGVTGGTDSIEDQNLLNNPNTEVENNKSCWRKICDCITPCCLSAPDRSPSPPPVSQIDLIPSHDEAPTRSLVLLLSVPATTPTGIKKMAQTQDCQPSSENDQANSEVRCRYSSIPSSYTPSPRGSLVDSGSESIHTRRQKIHPRTTYIKKQACLPYDRSYNNGWQKDWSSSSEETKEPTTRRKSRKEDRKRCNSYSSERKMPGDSARDTCRSGRGTPRARQDNHPRESMYEIYTEKRFKRGAVKKAFDLYEEKMEEEEATKIEKEFLRLLDLEISLDSIHRINGNHMYNFIEKVEDGTINTDKLARIFAWIKRLRWDKRTMIMYELLSALEAQKEGVQDRWYNRYIPFGMLFSCSNDPWERIRWAKSKLDEGNFNKTILGRETYDCVLSCTAPLLQRLGKFNWQQQEAIIDKTLSQGAKMGLMPSSEYYNARAFLLIDRRLNKQEYTKIVLRIIDKLGDLSRAPKFVREHRLDRTLLTENKYLGLRAYFADPRSTYDYMEGIGEMESDSELT